MDKDREGMKQVLFRPKDEGAETERYGSAGAARQYLLMR